MGLQWFRVLGILTNNQEHPVSYVDRGVCVYIYIYIIIYYLDIYIILCVCIVCTVQVYMETDTDIEWYRKVFCYGTVTWSYLWSTVTHIPVARKGTKLTYHITPKLVQNSTYWPQPMGKNATRQTASHRLRFKSYWIVSRVPWQVTMGFLSLLARLSGIVSRNQFWEDSVCKNLSR